MKLFNSAFGNSMTSSRERTVRRWHDLRRSFATLADQIGMTIGERQALMGHAKAAQTLQYTHTPGEQAIRALEELARKVSETIQ